MTEPVLGWRIWNVRDGRLDSWAVSYRWERGENRAACLVFDRRPCASPPGRRCQCGFWAVWSPLQCLDRARAATEPPWGVAMGLVIGWGTVALHGREGFRAERAAVRCLFTDRPWSRLSRMSAATQPPHWWQRLLYPTNAPAEAPGLEGSRSEPDNLDELEAVAAHYAVPLLSLRGAVSLGVLGELGVPAEQVREAARLAAASSTGP